MKLPSVGSMVLIKDNMKGKTLLNIGLIESEIKGKDGVKRGIKIRLGSGYVIERPFQLEAEGKIELEENVESKDTLKSATRRAKSDARQKISCILEDEMEVD